MTGTSGASTRLVLQSSENARTGMVPELVWVTPLDHRADSVSVTSEVGRVVTPSVNDLVSQSRRTVPTGTAHGRLERVIRSLRRSLLATSQVTSHPPPSRHETDPVIVLW